VKSEVQPVVGIVMGSSSDQEIMAEAATILEHFAIPYEMRVISAHRAPEALFEYAQGARPRGIRILIAGAGGAAHLPGVLAATTTLPVIGVPISLARLDGMDSLLSIVQMPRGVPVATMAINGAANAGVFSARILALADESIAAALDAYRRELADRSLAQDRDLKRT
jgi:5-(carboxyamino)imidazole ribonucleotide mutase